MLDAQPDHLDYRSELASSWNDLGLALDGAERYEEAAAAQERAAGLQRVAVEAAPQVSRYRRLFGNHLFNRAMALTRSGRATEAAAAAGDGRQVAPEDPEQWFREARILAILAARPGDARYRSSADDPAPGNRPRVRRSSRLLRAGPRRFAGAARISVNGPRVGTAAVGKRVTGPVGVHGGKSPDGCILAVMKENYSWPQHHSSGPVAHFRRRQATLPVAHVARQGARCRRAQGHLHQWHVHDAQCPSDDMLALVRDHRKLCAWRL